MRDRPGAADAAQQAPVLGSSRCAGRIVIGSRETNRALDKSLLVILALLTAVLVGFALTAHLATAPAWPWPPDSGSSHRCGSAPRSTSWGSPS